MDFSLTEEQVMLADTARRVGERFGLEYWREKDCAKAYPSEIWQEICDSGLCAVAIPEELGGSGLGMLELAIAVEAVCAAGGGSSLSQLFMLNPIFGGVTISKFGTDDQKKMLLGMADGSLQFCMALTEPDAGSNALNISTFARKDGAGWRLNGSKIWITSVAVSQKMLVVARTQPPGEVSRKTDGVSMFVIDTDRAGVQHTSIEKVGTQTLPSSAVFFDNVEIKPDELVGTLHGGFHELLHTLNTERIVTAAGLIGTAHLARKLAVSYANDRKVFGNRAIGSYQGVQFPLAESHIEATCAQLMNFKAATLHDKGLPYGSEANQAKWMAGRAAGHATDRAMQTMGGMGYSKEFHVERLWRDARLFRIAPVSEEMVLNFVAQHDLGMPRSY